MLTNCIEDSRKMLVDLAAPFNLDDIEWRVQAASARQNGGYRVLVLPYLTSRAIMNRLDQVCGGFWQSHFDKIVVSGKEAFQCQISIKINGEWIARTDGADITDIESVKGGHSNALKRAGVQWGIGRYLYELPTYWVDVKPSGKHNVYGNFKVNRQDTFIKGYFDAPNLPEWALPKGVVQERVKAPKNANQNNKGNITPDEQTQKAYSLVNALLHSLNVPKEFVQPLFERSIGGKNIPFERATAEQLGSLYHVLVPVNTYVKSCSQLGLDQDKMLYYAQIILKVPLDNIYSLFLKMNKDNCTKTLELVKADLKDVKAV